MSLRDLMSREPLELPRNETTTVQFSGAEVLSKETRQPVILRGEIDFDKYEGIEMRMMNPRTGLPTIARGIRLLVSEENGEPVDKPYNMVSKRMISILAKDLQDGTYTGFRYAITPVGAPPKTKFGVTKSPVL